MTDVVATDWRRWRFLLLTLVLCAWMFIAPYVRERWLAHLLMQLFLIQFVVVTLWANPRWGLMGRLLIACWVLSLVGALVEVAPAAAAADRMTGALQNLLSVPLFVLLAAGILRYVFTRRQLDTDGIFATIAVYLLLAFAFAQVYVALLAWSRGSLHLTDAAVGAEPHRVQAEMIYYSLVTLATVGYGDVLPVSETARTVAVIEATVGQFYIAVIVAVFVGMYSSERRNAA